MDALFRAPFRVLTVAAMMSPIWTCGCVSDAVSREAIAEYRRASDALGEAAEQMFVHANTVEAESYIDARSFEGKSLSQDEIDQRAVLSPDGLRVRRRAIKVLSQYTEALAEVAAGQSEERIAADATAAGTGMATLATDVQAAVAKDSSQASTADLSGPIAAATHAAGEVLQMLERRHSRTELQASLAKNDPAMRTLFEMIGEDAEHLYERERESVGRRGATLYLRYDSEVASSSPSPGYVLDLSDRIKRFRRDREAVRMADPQPALAAWSKSHDALIALLLSSSDKQDRKRSLVQVMTDVSAFSAAVQSLTVDVPALVTAR